MEGKDSTRDQNWNCQEQFLSMTVGFMWKGNVDANQALWKLKDLFRTESHDPLTFKAIVHKTFH